MRRATRDAVRLAILVMGISCTDPVSEGNPVGTVSIETSRVDLALGETASVTATVFDIAGRELPGRTIHWASKDVRVARVLPGGVVTGVGAGTTVVTAESGGQSAEVTVSVTVAFRSVSAGLFHTCAVTAAGFAACWGTNGTGELGDGTLFSSSAPVLVDDEMLFFDVAVGGNYSCGLNRTGAVLCWGANWSAQLGVGMIDNEVHPQPTWIGGLPKADAIGLGDRHACAVVPSGAILCWGGGPFGQLGIDTASAICPLLEEPCNPDPTPIQSSERFRAVDAGIEHTCAVMVGGAMRCWGDNFFGQLGDGTTDARATPTPVLGGLAFVSVSAGGGHTCGITDTGAAYCWGSNFLGQIGADAPSPVTAPVPVSGNLRFTGLTTGDDHTCGVTAAGTLYCWGANQFGQLGVGLGTAPRQPTVVAGGIPFASVSAGAFHTCGVATDGITYCWGLNTGGQLGTGGGLIAATPTRVTGQP